MGQDLITYLTVYVSVISTNYVSHITAEKLAGKICCLKKKYAEAAFSCYTEPTS